MVSYFINSKTVLENFNSTDYQKKLSICLETNGFSFAVENEKNKLLAFADVACNYPETLSQVIEMIKKVFSDLGIEYMLMDEIELIVPANKHTWIPEHLFDQARLREYFSLTTPLDVKETVFYSFSEKLQAYSLFAYSDTIISAFKVAIPGIKVKIQHAKMLETPLLEKSRMKTNVEIYLRKDYFDVAVFDSKNFLISNTYRYSTADDVAYYALLLLKQFRLNQDAIEIYLSGKADRNIYACLERFFRKVTLYTGKKLEFATNDMYHLHLYQYSMLFR